MKKTYKPPIVGQKALEYGYTKISLCLLEFPDDFRRYTWVILMKCKFEAPHIIKDFFKYVDTQFKVRIKAVRSDNAKELRLDAEMGTESITDIRTPWGSKEKTIPSF